MPSLAQLIVWVVVGLIGGSLATVITTWHLKGHGLARNLGIGLAGALLGGLLVRALGLFPRLDAIVISLRDVVAAVIGSLLVLAALWCWRRFKKPAK